MMIESHCGQDVALDTNILAQAENTGSPHSKSSLTILEWMRGNPKIRWVLDDTGKTAPDLRTSVLLTEYRQTLPPGSFGLILLKHCLASGRFSFSRRPGPETKKAIQHLIPRNKKDRCVLGAAVGSRDKVLLSNDFLDFTAKVRQQALRDFKVLILDSESAVT